MLPSWRNIASKVQHVFCFCFFRRFCRREIRVFSRFPWSPSVTQKHCRKRLVWLQSLPSRGRINGVLSPRTFLHFSSRECSLYTTVSSILDEIIFRREYSICPTSVVSNVSFIARTTISVCVGISWFRVFLTITKNYRIQCNLG